MVSQTANLIPSQSDFTKGEIVKEKQVKQKRFSLHLAKYYI